MTPWETVRKGCPSQVPDSPAKIAAEAEAAGG
jgi:hypothetical protein